MKTKKQLKEEYKLLKFRVGVFQIRNIVNNKIYVDSSVNLDAIWNRHRTQLRFGVHPNALLQADWNEYGEENFRYEIIQELIMKEDDKVNPASELKLLETLVMEELQPFEERGYLKKK